MTDLKWSWEVSETHVILLRNACNFLEQLIDDGQREMALTSPPEPYTMAVGLVLHQYGRCSSSILKILGGYPEIQPCKTSISLKNMVKMTQF